jgi:hypothetical protein
MHRKLQGCRLGTRLGTGLLDWEQGVQPAQDQLIIHPICRYEGKPSMRFAIQISVAWRQVLAKDEKGEDLKSVDAVVGYRMH